MPTKRRKIPKKVSGVHVVTTPELPGKPRIVNALTAYPNPFATTTNISYELTRPSDVQVEVFDVLGKRVHLFDSGIKPSGEHVVTFDASGLPSGVYFYTLTTGDFTQTRKMVVVK